MVFLMNKILYYLKKKLGGNELVCFMNKLKNIFGNNNFFF